MARPPTIKEVNVPYRLFIRLRKTSLGGLYISLIDCISKPPLRKPNILNIRKVGFTAGPADLFNVHFAFLYASCNTP
jgi:hypothetical protein